MDEDPIRALTGRRRTRPTSPGCRKPQQPKPGRTPLIAVYAAVQINRATSVTAGSATSCKGVDGSKLHRVRNTVIRSGAAVRAITISFSLTLVREEPEKRGMVNGRLMRFRTSPSDPAELHSSPGNGRGVTLFLRPLIGFT